jgi:hypothetical protein
LVFHFRSETEAPKISGFAHSKRRAAALKSVVRTSHHSWMPCLSPPLSPPFAVIAARFVTRASSFKKSVNRPHRPLVVSQPSNSNCRRTLYTNSLTFSLPDSHSSLYEPPTATTIAHVHGAAHRSCLTRTITDATTTDQCCIRAQ